ncbi:tail fiber domain-containing protein [Lewinella sp. 4G2]|uniref:tail fiber domain-containing protein n=1 Tax=Lewinella sp. 4G2 TaxID=1803372 RepID=UPI0007B4A8E6|nr:tail fiber domain-containing protein [Lewinella sp. 4G2]OAV43425.1 hypothetical protein A3850_002455 [Lewinella sp. 4G2]
MKKEFLTPTLALLCLVVISQSLSAQIFVDSTGSNGFGDLPHPMAKSRFSNADHEYNLFVRSTGADTVRGVGIYNVLDSGLAEKYGLWNHVEQAMGATGLTYGVRNVVSHGGDMDAYGIYNDLSNTADAKGRLFGNYSIIDDRGARAQNKLFANFYGETVHRKRNNAYGSYIQVKSYTQDAAKTSYGQYIDIKGGGQAARYGLYSNINGGSGYAGYFVGDVHVNGTFTQASDERLKKNVKNIEGALDIVNSLKPHTYSYKASEKMGFGEEEIIHYGFVAQEVAKVLPDLVTDVHHPYTTDAAEIATAEQVDEQGFPSVVGGTEKSAGSVAGSEAVDIRGVRYMDMIAILVGAVQEQGEVIADKERQLRSLQDEQELIRSELIELRDIVNTFKNCIPCIDNQDEKSQEQETRLNSITVYPNPATNYVKVRQSGNIENLEIRVVSIQGQTIVTRKFNTAEIRISTTGWIKGSYVIEVLKQNELFASEKIVVQ